MSGRKLVSVVTGTWNRHELLLGAIENVRRQTYRPLEHVIVADGPDRAVRLTIQDEQQRAEYEGFPEIVFQELGFHSSSTFTDSISAAPFMVAQLLARGDYQVWLADDERWLEPTALEKMVRALEDYDADFVYPKVACYREPPNPRHDMVIGSNPPRHGQFTHCLYRRDALDQGALFRTHVGSGTDWDACSRMMSNGLRWAFVPEVLLSHRIDK